ncbi:MAG: nicotinate-nucleotide--dimethylbenzimidazole phosphoribosyltransferase, partial [Chloroflexi bacterium]|nr:nicotinate-nucleotide--dimethylbenzimidazole phosphoribosyltransferase [Chloroflexota bacterium]
MGELLQKTIRNIKALDIESMAKAKVRQDCLTKPGGSLCILEELSIRLAGIKRQAIPVIKDKVIIIMAGDHGVVAEGVSAYPQAVTGQMVRNFLDGGAAINVLSRYIGARVTVVDMGVAVDLIESKYLLCRKIARGTANMAIGPAMSRLQAESAVETGIQVVQEEIGKGLDIVGTGDMGIGNTTASSA